MCVGVAGAGGEQVGDGDDVLAAVLSLPLSEHNSPPGQADVGPVGLPVEQRHGEVQGDGDAL